MLASAKDTHIQMEGKRQCAGGLEDSDVTAFSFFTWVTLICSLAQGQIPVYNFCSRKRKLSYFLAPASHESL